MKSAYSEFVSFKEAIPQSEAWAKVWRGNPVNLLHYIVADAEPKDRRFASIPNALREALLEVIEERSEDLVGEALLRMRTRRDMLKEEAKQEVQAELGLRG